MDPALHVHRYFEHEIHPQTVAQVSSLRTPVTSH